MKGLSLTIHHSRTTMTKIGSYFSESYKELTEKVTWPNWMQLQQSTIIVLIATLLVTAIVFLMDLASRGLLDFIYGFFKS
jgi:preprotein translocase subunit SecE